MEFKKEWDDVLQYCCVTGKPMGEGWLWVDVGYTMIQAMDVVNELKKNHKHYDIELEFDGEPRSDDDLLEAACNLDIVFWTEWWDDYPQDLIQWMDNEERIKMVCKYCGGDDVIQYAEATWNVEKQDYDYDTPDYNGLEYCRDCNNSTEVIVKNLNNK